MNAAVLEYLADTFEKVRLLKKSDKGEVWLASQKSGNLVIWKHIFHTGIPYVQLKENHHALWPEIFYVAEDEQQTIVIEEYISGHTLAECIEEEKYLSEKEAMMLLIQLCRGLAALHGMGIIHRDIKPANLIWQNGNVRLLDFDASRRIKKRAGEDTRLLGTKGYAPPEQFGYGQTDARSDIYALGVTMQEVLGPQYHGYLLNILKKCRRMDPEARYPSVQRLQSAVWRYRHRGFFAGMVVLSVVLLLGAGYFYRQHAALLPVLLQEEMEIEKKQASPEQDESREEAATDEAQEEQEQTAAPGPGMDDTMHPGQAKPAGVGGVVSSSISLNGESWHDGRTISVPPAVWSTWEWRSNQYTQDTLLPDDWVLKVRIENQSDRVLENPRVKINYAHEDKFFYGPSLSAGEAETIQIPLHSYRVSSWSQFSIYVQADSGQKITDNFYRMSIYLADVGQYKMEHGAQP